jgi:hypothetical protein
MLLRTLIYMLLLQPLLQRESLLFQRISSPAATAATVMPLATRVAAPQARAAGIPQAAPHFIAFFSRYAHSFM